MSLVHVGSTDAAEPFFTRSLSVTTLSPQFQVFVGLHDFNTYAMSDCWKTELLTWL